jgi:uncharacterized protein YjiS (DUF1127 family)
MMDQIRNIRFTYQMESICLGHQGNGWAIRVAAQRCGGHNGARSSAFRPDLEVVMPAITTLAMFAAAPVGRALAVLGGRATRAVKRLGARWKNRRDAMQLATLDDHMLADIGLTRSDLRDAYSEPLWHDPTDVLAQRAAERRSSRPRAGVPCTTAMQSAAPLEPILHPWCRPPTDRPARYLM